ncbi:MAG: tRNA (adenine(22)-N(1))-methyltransferase [Lachnospiraceae bacterium]
MQLSKRLLAAAGLVTKGNRVADVGCDHAYTSIFLCNEEISPSVIAMDVNKGPLMRARQNVAGYGLEDRIALRLSDGLAALSVGEADTILLTGMGGLLMMKILSDYPQVTASAKELILQPQSEVAQVRRYLHTTGYQITTERMVKEDGKFYVMMRAVKAEVPERYDRECRYAYGRELVAEDVPVLLEFLEKERSMREQVLSGLLLQETKKAKERVQELKKELRLIEEAENDCRDR